ncbi:DUF5079 family protein [Hyphomicrobium sp. NDB2Meth4]|uniref:DUF5079 family protein n=1 Tax=Hyphomicrobium sp. NDB2Meth4 TaxID=1892846 RepID=UPI00093027F3|nr:DUF5079 family protein [Hyphomicrobium sp. NDB2Meth4]
MSLRSLPSIILAFILYNVVVFVSGGTDVLKSSLFELNMLSGGVWQFTVGDLIVLLTLFLLFAEIVKSTYTSTSSLVDHGLSMVVFIACIVEFLLVPQAATSTFFLIMVATAIDVVAGFTIGIRVARRDLAIGGAVD